MCAAQNSPLLSFEGTNLIGGLEYQTLEEAEDANRHPHEAEKEDLFNYGIVAKISGVQGSRSDSVLIVEG
ncbi:hypothetical protein MMC22_009665, partial [Lobaria immixta]|nr:hypothetical protein [Lobaria immixta]